MPEGCDVGIAEIAEHFSWFKYENLNADSDVFQHGSDCHLGVVHVLR